MNKKTLCCICCPKCAKFHEKSTMTESLVKCSRCGCEYAALVKNGVVTIYDTNVEACSLEEAFMTLKM